MMNIVEDAYSELRKANIIKNKTELAEKLNYHRTYVSGLINGKEEITENVELLEGNNSTSEPIETKNGLEYIEQPDGSYIVTVDLVPFEAHSRYVSDDVQEYGEWELKFGFWS